jgi:glycosyltransferase involved in cell wall biosynthesis
MLKAVYARDVQFDEMMARRMKYLKGEIFWGFQGSCHASLKAARAAGKLAICELATGHVIASISILGEERDRKPEWADSFDNLIFPDEYLKRLNEEPHRADVVVGASDFTLKTLRHSGVHESKLRLLPLGADISMIRSKERAKRHGKLKLLYAGRVTQRKGVSYLLDAMRILEGEPLELHIIGNVQGSGRALVSYKDFFTLHPLVSQFTLFKRYCEFDALVLPTLFEGFGLVILEAMAAGLPVITTENSVGPSVITEDVNGYVVPVRDAHAIASAILKLLSKSDLEWQKMSENARLAAHAFSWDAYRKRMNAFLEPL